MARDFYWFLAVVAGILASGIYGLSQGRSAEEELRFSVQRAVSESCDAEIEQAIKDLNRRLDDSH